MKRAMAVVAVSVAMLAGYAGQAVSPDPGGSTTALGRDRIGQPDVVAQCHRTDHNGQPIRGVSDVPVLLVLCEADPQDPPSNVADAPIDLLNSLTVVVPGHGHTVGHLGCMPSVVVAS